MISLSNKRKKRGERERNMKWKDFPRDRSTWKCTQNQTSTESVGPTIAPQNLPPISSNYLIYRLSHSTRKNQQRQPRARPHIADVAPG